MISAPGGRVASSVVAPDDLKIPPTMPGMTIGLFGGSFNPPHAGHLHVAEVAMRRLQLDRMWIMVTPGNPLKELAGLPGLATRIAATRAMISDPRIVVSGFESTLGSSYSWMTVRRLVRSYPQVRFVWVMGADNLAGFHRWQNWRRIAAALPLVVVDRPGAGVAALSSPAATTLRRWRLPEAMAPVLPHLAAPAWIFVHAPLNGLSSTRLRAEGRGLPLG